MNIEKKDFEFLIEMARQGADEESGTEHDDHVGKIDALYKKYKESSFDKIEVMEEVYRQFLKGTLTEKKLAYRTSRDHILHELKIKLDVFLNNLKKDEII